MFSNINIEEYRYNLPKERIAQYPAEQRDRSKLLVMKKGELSSIVFKDLPDLLPQNTLLLFNNTRVIRARLLFIKNTGAEIEIFFLNPILPSTDHQVSFGSGPPVTWECIIGNARKWKGGELKHTFLFEGENVELYVRIIERRQETFLVELSWKPENISLADVFETVGHTPLPPYINREDEPVDAERYQTVYAFHNGSVAAPTAGLHFTPEMLKTLETKNILQQNITLHVGAGTFKPVTAHNISNHIMHHEEIIVTCDLLMDIAFHKGPVIPVGTTSVRSLESVYWYGVRVLKNIEMLNNNFHVEQWEPYLYNFSYLPAPEEVFSNLAVLMEKSGYQSLRGITSLMIVPGYRFAFSYGLITNFHQSGSTLLLLVAALIGDDWKKAYRYALENDFRFLSYGDACLFLPENKL